MSRPSPRLVVHIERLVLEGLPLRSVDGPLVREAFETELTRLLYEGGLAPALAGGGAMASVLPADMRSPASREPSALGVQVAQGLYGRLRP